MGEPRHKKLTPAGKGNRTVFNDYGQRPFSNMLVAGQTSSPYYRVTNCKCQFKQRLIAALIKVAVSRMAIATNESYGSGVILGIASSRCRNGSN